MDIVISIVSWNTADLLRRCLMSLRMYVDSSETRIIVLDNESRDGTPAMIRSEFPEVTLIETGSNLGFGRAHNLIAKISTEPFVLFLNPDTEFCGDSHTQMASFMRTHPEVGLVGCRMVNLDGSTQQLGFQWRSSPLTELTTHLMGTVLPWSVMRRMLPWHDPLKDGYVRKLYGGCLMARREVLDQVGWFDDRFFMYAEDVDLSRRVESAGKRLFYLSQTRVIHLCGGASAKVPGRFSTLMQCESISKLMDKYFGLTGSLIYRFAVIARALFVVGILAIPVGLLSVYSAKTPFRLKHYWLKHLAMLRWSIGLERAQIPQ